eukprot:6187491-Pyramimonas_sp.AAC.1
MHSRNLLPLGVERAQPPTTSPETTKLPMHSRAISKHMHVEQHIGRTQGPYHTLLEARARKQPGR